MFYTLKVNFQSLFETCLCFTRIVFCGNSHHWASILLVTWTGCWTLHIASLQLGNKERCKPSGSSRAFVSVFYILPEFLFEGVRISVSMVYTGTQSKLSSKQEKPGALDTLHMVTNPTVPPWDLDHTVVLMPVNSLSDVLIHTCSVHWWELFSRGHCWMGFSFILNDWVFKCQLNISVSFMLGRSVSSLCGVSSNGWPVWCL